MLSVDLLYPIKEKNYDQNKYIREAWNQACEFIHYAERITFFGYSAPKSDVVAVNRISESLSRSPYKKIKKVEIINIDNEDKLMTSYSRLIPSCIQTNYVKSYYDSSLAKYPRRTSDYLFHTLQCNETSSLFNQYISFLERDDLFSIAKKIRAIGDMIEPWYNEHPLSKQQILMKMGIKLNGISRR